MSDDRETFESILKAVGWGVVPLTDTAPDPGRQAPRVATRMVYAEDVTPGMIFTPDHQCGIGHLIPGHACPQEWETILEVRTGGGVVSVIAVDEEGEQQAHGWNALMPVRVRVDG